MSDDVRRELRARLSKGKGSRVRITDTRSRKVPRPTVSPLPPETISVSIDSNVLNKTVREMMNDKSVVTIGLTPTQQDALEKVLKKDRIVIGPEGIQGATFKP